MKMKESCLIAKDDLPTFTVGFPKKKKKKKKNVNN